MIHASYHAKFKTPIRKVSKLRATSKSAIFIENRGHGIWSGVDTSISDTSTYFIHNKKANVSFVDGHAESRGYTGIPSYESTLYTGMLKGQSERLNTYFHLGEVKTDIGANPALPGL